MDRELSRRIAEKQAYNDFGTALSGDYQELCNVELEFGCSRGGLPTEEVIRAVKELAKRLKTHLYYTLAGEVSTGDKPHHHLAILVHSKEHTKLILGLERARTTFLRELRKCLKWRTISIANRRDRSSLSKSPRAMKRINGTLQMVPQTYTPALEYKNHYFSEHEAWLPMSVACPMRSQSCRKSVKRDGCCKHHLKTKH
jgi:hypothetical protein